MGTIFCHRAHRCNCHRPANSPATSPANFTGNSNFTNKNKAIYTNIQNNVQLLNFAVPVSVINISGNAIQIPILSNNAIAIMGTASTTQSNTASGGNLTQPAIAAFNQNNDD